ncbi:MAG: hypothetical protein K2X82_05415, partial [Gemmataceae bacterium]|nr:hypothetical protein [Gemmataceae bacterium]
MASASPNRPPKFSHQSFGSAVARSSVHAEGVGGADRFKWVEPAPAPEPPDDDRPVASPARAARPPERSGP